MSARPSPDRNVGVIVSDIPRLVTSDVAEVAADVAFLDAVRSIPAVDARKVRLPDTLGVRPGDVVLEIGPGTGEDLQRFAAAAGPNGLGVGVELVPGIAAEAKRRAVGVPNAAFVVADARRLPFPNEAFGAAYAERVLQPTPDILEGTAELVAEAVADGVMPAEVGDAYLAELGGAVTEGTAVSIWVAFEAAATKPLTLG